MTRTIYVAQSKLQYQKKGWGVRISNKGKKTFRDEYDHRLMEIEAWKTEQVLIYKLKWNLKMLKAAKFWTLFLKSLTYIKTSMGT